MPEMRAEKIIKKLVENFGKERVLIRNEYHIQIDSDKGYHDIWINKFGALKMKRAGTQKTIEDIDINQIIAEISRVGKTDVEKMKSMFDFTKFIGEVQNRSRIIGDGIFTDAGYKNGEARIAAILIQKDEIHAISKNIKTKSILEAEQKAILLGMSLNSELPIYNDNKSACESYPSNRVQWLSRKFTKPADKIANLRKNENN